MISERPMGSAGPELVLESPAFAAGDPIPLDHTGDGLNLSPPLHWHGEPEATRSFVLILEDPEAPAGLWVHWLVADIPARVHSLPQGLPRRLELENGAWQGRCWGVERFARIGYYGPQPPEGPPHHYRFRLFALDQTLPLPPGATPPQVKEAMAGHLLAETSLVGTYGRSRRGPGGIRTGNWS
jgi:Raf kinase inhibitor-like YbhB/YbcL family protein